MDQNPYESPTAGSPVDQRPTSFVVGGVEYSIDCECGATNPVSASQAGGSLACRCGRVLRVPRLSQLRMAKGLSAHETNIRDSIVRMIRDNVLPWGQC